MMFVSVREFELFWRDDTFWGGAKIRVRPTVAVDGVRVDWHSKGPVPRVSELARGRDIGVSVEGGRLKQPQRGCETVEALLELWVAKRPNRVVGVASGKRFNAGVR